MRQQLQQRLDQLKSELENGNKMMADLETRRAQLQSTILRIEGAVQVLQEMLEQSEPPAS